MKQLKTITLLTFLTSLFSLVAATVGIFSKDGPGKFEFESIRNQSIEVYGKGIYKLMSQKDAIATISQDYFILLLGIPTLLVALYLAKKGSLKGKIILSGSLLYFLTTYVFIMSTTVFNPLFLAYVGVISSSFFALALTLSSFDLTKLSSYFDKKIPVKFIGGFLILGAISTAWSWLSLVVPPLFNNSIPVGLEHYTTMVIQGFDLSIFLPISFISGVLLIKRRPFGYFMAPIYLSFLVLLMASVAVKMFGQIQSGINVPFFLPMTFASFTILSAISLSMIFRGIREK